jgi:hypothetical protein
MDIALDGEMEYDDYIPDLPGSYFNMDPHAYTLTWSQQQPWATGAAAAAGVTGVKNGHELTTRAPSQTSLQNNSHQTSNC